MSTTTLRRSTTRAKTSKVTIITQGVSKDLLVSYINFMRQYMQLDPIMVDQDLCKNAQRRAYVYRKDHRIAFDPDRSPHSVTRSDMTAWVHFSKHSSHDQGVRTVTVPFTESNEYLSYILNYRCSSFGMYTYENPEVSNETFTVQIFELNDDEAYATS